MSLLKGETMEPVNYYEREMQRHMEVFAGRVEQELRLKFGEYPGICGEETIDVPCEVVEPIALPPKT